MPSGCIEVVNVVRGSVIVQFRINPPGRGGDDRDGEDLMVLLESHLVNPFSALRKGAFGIYAASAELKSEDPLRERTPGASPREEGQPETLPEALALLAHARGRIKELEE